MSELDLNPSGLAQWLDPRVDASPSTWLYVNSKHQLLYPDSVTPNLRLICTVAASASPVCLYRLLARTKSEGAAEGCQDHKISAIADYSVPMRQPQLVAPQTKTSMDFLDMPNDYYYCHLHSTSTVDWST